MNLEKKIDSKINEDISNNLSKNNTWINDWNIFSELSWELDFWKKDEYKINVIKDKMYYMKLCWTVLLYINIVLFLITSFFYTYLYIQNDSSMYNTAYLDTFCWLLLSKDMKNTWEHCSSVASLIPKYNEETEELKKEFSKKISWIIYDLYIKNNFNNSDEVKFLLKNSKDRMKIINILNDFDNMKNDFSGWDKGMIKCSNTNITDNNTLTINCDVYSSSWEEKDNNWKWIIWSTWNRNSSLMEWSSITLAASFLNFIEKNPKYNFELVDKQKSFTSESIVWDDTSYVKKTTINMKLKYINLNNN